MRLVRFLSGGTTHFGLATDDTHAHALRLDFDQAGLLAAFAAGTLPSALAAARATAERRGEGLRVDKLLAPLVPTDLLCIGLNYREHAAESGSALPQNPMLFIKASNALNHPFDPIPLPRRSAAIDYEAELVVVIGKAAKDVPRERAVEYVLGYTAGNDVSARDWQRDKALGGGQFARGKSFDGFCPLGPAVVTADEIPNPNALRIRTLLNGRVMQDHTTADMIFDVPALIESLSSTMTLRAGSVILTGTPQGVGFARTPPVWLTDGDTVVVELERVGRLENPVRREAPVRRDASGHREEPARREA